MSQLEHEDNKQAIGAPRRAGRPKYVPDDKDRRMVLVMAGFHLPHEDIADVIGIARCTLEKAFRKELRRGRAHVTSTILTKFHEALERNEWRAIEWGLRFYLGDGASKPNGSVLLSAETQGIKVEFITAAPKPDDPMPVGAQYDPRAPRPISRREMYDAANVGYPHRIEGKANRG